MLFRSDLLQETGVAITPGTDFGEREGHHYVRLAYTTAREQLMEAVKRIADFVKNR